MARKRIRCYTRALKNARYLQRNGPNTFRREDRATGFGTGIPLAVLQQADRLRHDSSQLAGHEAVSRFIERHEMFRRAATTRRPPLFSGMIHFAQITFETPGGVFSFSMADMRTMIRYAKHAIVPIARMVRAYGKSSITISPKILRFTAKMPARRFSDLELQSWIRKIAKAHGLSEKSCVLVPCPKGISELSGGVGANSGYHSFSPAPKVPYIVLGVHGVNLKLSDRPDLYAMAISHEIAEMIVDPRANHANPEVCDPCCLNCCAKFYRAYFGPSNAYLGTNRRTVPGGYRFAYFTAVVVQPSGVATRESECVATRSDCDYRP